MDHFTNQSKCLHTALLNKAGGAGGERVQTRDFHLSRVGDPWQIEGPLKYPGSFPPPGYPVGYRTDPGHYDGDS